MSGYYVMLFILKTFLTISNSMYKCSCTYKSMADELKIDFYYSQNSMFDKSNIDFFMKDFTHTSK